MGREEAGKEVEGVVGKHGERCTKAPPLSNYWICPNTYNPSSKVPFLQRAML